MTASMEHTVVRKPSGFTIDSIIGKDSEKSDTTHRRRSFEAVATSPSPDICKKDRFKIHSKDFRSDLPSSSHDQRKELPPFSSLHDGRRLLDFSSVRRERESESFNGLHNASESLKHLHDVLAQTSGATGTYFPPRVCRHPLSNLNLHSVYQSQFQHTATPLHPLVLNSTRDIRSLHPWVADRYPGYYYPRYPAPGFLFQPYRKPKRIRTAFSPSQLLQLEKAFEKSHYVVGQERKDLAAELQLTETQVKVWFQNRRTKHKRIKSEDGEDPASPDNDGSKFTGSDVEYKDSESDISDIDDVCDTDHITIMHQHVPT